MSNTVIDPEPPPTEPPSVLLPTLSNREDVGLSETMLLSPHWEMRSYWHEPIWSSKKEGQLEMAAYFVSDNEKGPTFSPF